jgi:UDP-GlcNAc:undecaprenyl-phosphate/decaprenyl-phosphate GlcNAc-1-phosphate transferase
LWLLAVVGFGALGLLDDVRGDKKIQGLRGHFQAALRERKITTGFIKAIGGGLLALYLGWRLFPEEPLRAVLAAALIALFANAVNLLDLRPGRAGAVFLLCALLLLLAAFRSEAHVGIPPLLYVFLPALIVWERDARARVMLGDAGSNPLGAALGLALAQIASVALLILVLLALIVLHVVAERASLTKLIEANRLLRALDRLTGVR